MTISMKKTGLAAVAATALLAIASPAFAQDAGVSAETQYILNTFSFLFSGALVMWMAAGFAMLESGLVRTKNVSTILFKNIALFAVAGIMYYLIGYNLMYMDVSGWIGSLSLWSADDAAALGGDFSGGYSATSDWFFQMVFVATAASIVSGTVAERIKLWPFMIFVVVLTGVLYPITGAWTWGGGWLSEMGFADFAGSTIVHSVGGWAALTGAIILGARKGKYGEDGSVHPMPGSNLPLATLGTFVLWLGWFGFNGGSQLAMGSAADVIAIANIYGNTSMAAAGGVVAAAILTQILYKKVDLTMALNGIWGTLAVPFTNDGASFGVQLTGIVAMGAFTIVASAIVWLILKFTIGIRLSEEDEAMGSDAAELGLEAYPEFGKGSQRF